MNVLKKQPSILIIIALIGFPQLSESIFTPILPALSQGMSVTESTIQLMMSTYFFAFAFGVLYFGPLSDRIGRKKAMAIGLSIYLMGNLGLLLAPGFHWLLGARIIQAFGAASGSVITQTIMREAFVGEKRARIFAQVGAALALAPALGPLLGGLFQMIYGYHSVFSALIAMAVALLFYVATTLPETRLINNDKQGQNWLMVTKRLLSSPKVWSYGLLISGVNGILFSYYAEAPFIFIDHFKMTPVAYGWTGLLIAVASLTGSLVTNRLIGRFSGAYLMMLGLIVALLGAITMGLGATNVWVLFGAILVTFTGLNILLPIVLSNALLGFEDVIGTASGLFSFWYYLLISLLTFLMSLMHNGSIYILPIYILMVLSGMVFSFLVIWKTENHK
ncbi:multidrug effflux MFS transporter [Weissella coleopterorum]|uniref:Bcr/CflA family efflux transporter n=1 Tax=Weissella coleopterorum TaxID=2714949 RepID=A0A6G8B0K5_9LACO|nr:multidrug effflux MFS transporter [Weissella coleopterorum]QIL50786.1 multidrug effflux MFS transporter [Weissella coleopterorum]